MALPAAAPSPLSPVSPVIHLVADDEAVRQALALLIGTVGLRVQAWAHPQAFLNGFDRQTVGAIVLDVRMPGMSGLMLLDLMRQHGVDQQVVMLHAAVRCAADERQRLEQLCRYIACTTGRRARIAEQ